MIQAVKHRSPSSALAHPLLGRTLISGIGLIERNEAAGHLVRHTLQLREHHTRQRFAASGSLLSLSLRFLHGSGVVGCLDDFGRREVDVRLLVEGCLEDVIVSPLDESGHNAIAGTLRVFDCILSLSEPSYASRTSFMLRAKSSFRGSSR